jgi:hypothetical protein
VENCAPHNLGESIHLAAGMKDRRMVAGKELAYQRQAVGAELTDAPHGNLARIGPEPPVIAYQYVERPNLVFVGYRDNHAHHPQRDVPLRAYFINRLWTGMGPRVASKRTRAYH